MLYNEQCQMMEVIFCSQHKTWNKNKFLKKEERDASEAYLTTECYFMQRAPTNW